MQEQDFAHIVRDMDVCDYGGDKIGTIVRVHRHELAAVGSGPSGTSASDTERPHEDVLEVKTGFLGLGKHLYIPMSAVREVIGDCVFLSAQSHDDVEHLGWDQKPSYLEASD
jgi:hypothetical protein